MLVEGSSKSLQQEVLTNLISLQRDHRWIGKHFEQLLSEYPERFIAVYAEKVIETARTRRELMEKLKKHKSVRGPPAVEFVSSREIKFLL
jgi:hypothetical protein